MWGRYELIERIDAGPVAETWRARNVETNATVALKKLDGDLAAAPELTKKFSLVCEALRSPPHWDLVAVLDVGEVHGEPYSARPWIDGVSLAQLMESTARRKIPVLPPPLALTVVLSVIDALDKLHGASLVHGHLVGRNVFVLANGSVKVTDAGLTRVIEAAIAGQSVMATLWPQHDAAPEQMGADQADARTDVFAVAALLFELLTSSRPTERAEDGTIILPAATSRYVPPIFTPILGRALSEDRARRHPNVRTLGAELRTIAQMGYSLDAASVGLAVSALITHERMPLPPPVTELLSRFALTPEPPPNARRTTGDAYLVAVPTPPPLPAGTLIPRSPSKPNDLRAVVVEPPPSPSPDVDTQPSIRTQSGETKPASELNGQSALRAKSGETKVPAELNAGLRAKSGATRVPPDLDAELTQADETRLPAGLRAKSGETKVPAELNAGLRAKSGATRVPPDLAAERTQADDGNPPLSMTAPLPWSDEQPGAASVEDSTTAVDGRPVLGEDNPQTRLLAGVAGKAGTGVPLSESEPGPTRLLGGAVALGDVEPGPTPLKLGDLADVPTGPLPAVVNAPALGAGPDAPTGPLPAVINAAALGSGPDAPTGPVPAVIHPAALGATPDVPTGPLAAAAPPTNPRAVAPRPGSRLAPMLIALLALGGAGYVAYKTVLPAAEATVDISSTPPGADVLVNGELIERVTPTKLALPANKPYVIELQLPGKLPWSNTVTPTADSPLVIRADLKGLPSDRR